MSPQPARLLLAPDVPGLEALGAREAAALLEAERALATSGRARVLRARDGETVVRVPLPGTPDAAGQQHERPGGGGTGWLRVHRFRGAAGERLAARLRAPRSTSVAARAWNLACHLQAHGVPAPQLVALVERGVLGRESALVVRELEGFDPLPEALAAAAPRRRRLLLRALGLTLGALFRSGAWLPALEADALLVARSDLARSEQDCALLELARLGEERARAAATGLRRRRLPSIAVGDLRGGRVLPRVAPARRLGLLRRLDADLRASGGGLGERERLGVALLALGPQGRPALRDACR